MSEKEKIPALYLILRETNDKQWDAINRNSKQLNFLQTKLINIEEREVSVLRSCRTCGNMTSECHNDLGCTRENLKGWVSKEAGSRTCDTCKHYAKWDTEFCMYCADYKGYKKLKSKYEPREEKRCVPVLDYLKKEGDENE